MELLVLFDGTDFSVAGLYNLNLAFFINGPILILCSNVGGLVTPPVLELVVHPPAVIGTFNDVGTPGVDLGDVPAVGLVVHVLATDGTAVITEVLNGIVGEDGTGAMFLSTFLSIPPIWCFWAIFFGFLMEYLIVLEILA